MSFDVATLNDCRGLLTHRPYYLVRSPDGQHLHVLRRHERPQTARFARRDPGRAVCGRRATWIDAALCESRPVCPACLKSLQKLCRKRSDSVAP